MPARPARRATRTTSIRARRATATAVTNRIMSRARDPNHAAAGFPTTCELCHRPTDTSFDQGSFNHNQYFQRVGVHATQPCAACHKNSVYKGTPRDCYGCHRTDYEKTKNPNHILAGFPPTCELCHKPTDASFTGASLNHDQFFQRVGVHATQSCAACHKNNVYKGTPRDCFGCHQAKYLATSQSEPSRGRIPHDLRALPPPDRHIVQPRNVQPRPVLPARRRPRHPALRRLP